MKIACLALVAALYLTAHIYADTFGTGENQFENDFVTISNPGNYADTTGSPNPAGAVDYVYRIGKHEISREMVSKVSELGMA